MFITVKKKTVELILVLVLVVIALSGMIGGTIASVAAKERLVPIYSVDTDSKKIAISFDAAWGADKTKSIVDTLNKYRIKGTFFLVGFWIDKYGSQRESSQDVYDPRGSNNQRDLERERKDNRYNGKTREGIPSSVRRL